MKSIFILLQKLPNLLPNEINNAKKELDKENILISGDKEIFLTAFNNLNNNLKKLEKKKKNNKKIIKKIEPSEFDMMLKEKRKDLNKGDDGSYNINEDK
mgnify:CR=1 FL=1